jgi:NTP pyrophosphatase (non-canonical NTP hydrolase)
MRFEQLLEFIKKEDRRLKDNFENYSDEGKRALARTVKLSEELGELCDEVLGHNLMQRPEKLAKREVGNLSDEFADVIITALLLAETMGVDIEKALANKIEKIDKRYEK